MIKLLKDQCTKIAQQFIGHNDEVNCVSFSSNFEFLVTGSDDYRVHVFDVQTNHCLDRLEGHKGAVMCIAVSPCDRYFVSGSYDKTARIWKVTDRSCAHTLTGHKKSVEAVAFSPCSLYVCTGSWDRTACLWCVQTGCHIRMFRGHQSLVQSVAFSQTQEMLATGSWDFTIRIWTLHHIENMKVVHAFMNAGKILSNISEDAENVITQNNSIKNEMHDHEDHDYECIETRNCVGCNEESLYDGSEAGSTRTKERSNLKLFIEEETKGCRNLPGIGSVLDKNICYDGDTDSVLECKVPSTIEVLDRQETQGMRSTTEKLASQKTWLENKNCGEDSRLLIGHNGNVRTVAFSNLGLLVSGSWDKSVRLWNPVSGQCLRVLLGHTGWVQAVSFSPDATYCASAADDESVRIWDLVTGHCVNTLQGDTYLAFYCAFTSSGSLVASGAATPPEEKENLDADSARMQQAQDKLKKLVEGF